MKKSQLIGKIQAIEGIDHVIDNPNNINKRLSIKKGLLQSEQDGTIDITINSNEIIVVKNDPNNMEMGYIYFHLEGGRS